MTVTLYPFKSMDGKTRFDLTLKVGISVRWVNFYFPISRRFWFTCNISVFRYSLASYRLLILKTTFQISVLSPIHEQLHRL
jgi:hypothetical protein